MIKSYNNLIFVAVMILINYEIKALSTRVTLNNTFTKKKLIYLMIKKKIIKIIVIII